MKHRLLTTTSSLRAAWQSNRAAGWPSQLARNILPSLLLRCLLLRLLPCRLLLLLLLLLLRWRGAALNQQPHQLYLQQLEQQPQVLH